MNNLLNSRGGFTPGSKTKETLNASGGEPIGQEKNYYGLDNQREESK